MVILGINAYHGDVSAVLLRDGELVAAVEEERFQRVKEGKKGGEAGRRGGLKALKHTSQFLRGGDGWDRAV